LEIDSGRKMILASGIKLWLTFLKFPMKSII